MRHSTVRSGQGQPIFEQLEPRLLLHAIDAGIEVHQWITKEAYDFYASQVCDGQLAAYLTAPDLTVHSPWQDIADASNTYDGDDNVMEGTRDEDSSVATNPPPQNPFDQDYSWDRHFCHGGDGDELTRGLDQSWVPDFTEPFDEEDSYFSAYEQASHYFEGYGDFPGILDLYSSDKAAAYYYLGHVAHLLQDMTVPAHVHNDTHVDFPFLDWDYYEWWVADEGHFQLWGDGNGPRGGPAELRSYGTLEELFRATTDYTEEYPSCDWWGNLDGPADNEAEWPDTGRHRPDLIDGSDGVENWVAEVGKYEYEIIADDLMPFAMEQTAALYKFFMEQVSPVLPIMGDATCDAIVDGGDYTIWADHYLWDETSDPPVVPWSQGGWALGNFTEDTTVDGGDYTLWADNYAPAGGGAEALAAAAYDADDHASPGAPKSKVDWPALPSQPAASRLASPLSHALETGLATGREQSLPAWPLDWGMPAATDGRPAWPADQSHGARPASTPSTRALSRLLTLDDQMDLLEGLDLSVLGPAI